MLFVQNDAAAPRSVSGRHQLLGSGAVPLPARLAHPGRLRQLHARREGGAAARHPEQAPVQRARRRRQLRRGQLQLGPSLGEALGPGRAQERGEAGRRRRLVYAL